MREDQWNKIDTAFVQRCLQANQHNSLTSYYYLLLKKISLQEDFTVGNENVIQDKDIKVDNIKPKYMNDEDLV